MNRLVMGLSALILAMVGVGAAETPVAGKTFTTPGSGALSAEKPFMMDIDVGGASGGWMYADPPGCFFPWRQDFFSTVSLAIENKGSTPVKDPWIVMKGDPDFHSIGTMINSVVPADADDETKARSLYEFNRKYFFHEYLGTSDNIDPVRMFNVYGYGICGDDSAMLSALFEAAGLQVRMGRPNGHSTVEVKYGDKFRLLDGDVMIFAVNVDNASVIGEEDIVRDPYLLKRTHTFGLKNWGWANSRDEVSPGLWWYGGPRTRKHGVESGHTMGFTLRPSEKITWLWQERLKPLGLFTVDPKRDTAGKNFHGKWELVVGKDTLASYEKDGRLDIPFSLPYPVAGLSMAFPEGAPKSLEVSISRDGKDFKPVPLQTLRDGLVNDDFLAAVGLKRQDRPAYALHVRIDPKGGGLESLLPLSLKLDFQFAPRSMPLLRPGKNLLAYRDAAEARDVAVTVKWVENNNRPPSAPAAPVFPKDKGTVKGAKAFTFEWAPAADKDGTVTNYHFQLSEHADFRWPLSSNFDAMLLYTESKNTATFKLSWDGLLSPGRSYYWHVRARDDKGCWSEWSTPWTFKVEGPGIPAPQAPSVSQDARTVKLAWTVEGGTSKPAKYRVFGSPYRGFTPSMAPWKMIVESFASKDKCDEMAASFLFDTTAPGCAIAFDDAKKLMPFYRIQAVDAEGCEGCHSEQLELSSPLLLSTSPVNVPAGATRVPLAILSSSGRLVNFEGNAYRYGIGMGDKWSVDVLEQKGPKDLKVVGGESALSLSRPLKAGETAVCRTRVFGTSYIDFARSAAFDITLTGAAGKAEKPPAPLSAAAKPSKKAGETLLLDGGLDADTLAKGGKWTISSPKLDVTMRQVDDNWFITCAFPKEIKDAEKYASAVIPCAFTASDPAAPWSLNIEFSLIFATADPNAKCDIQLQGKNNQFINLAVAQWKPVFLARKIQPPPLTTPTPKSFNYDYNVPVRFRWVIDSKGKHALYRGDELMNEWEAVPGNSWSSPADICAFRVAFIMGENDGGSTGFGEFRITSTTYKNEVQK